MELIALMLIIYFLIGACICLLICVNPNDPGVLGTLNRFFFKKFPAVFSNVIRKLFGQGVLNFLGGIKHYIMETNHPIVQIFYLAISPGGFSCYMIYGIFKHMPNKNVSLAEVGFATVMALICFWVYYKACATEPGEITKQNVRQYIEKWKKYYDGQLYKEKNPCRTCQFHKPARSKHCSICKMCVSKYDHHCVWIRQCVGEKNYKYFVSFLFLHSIWCCFLSYIGTLSLMAYLDRINFYAMQFNMGGNIVKADGMLALQYLFMTETIFFFLIVMCAIMGITLFIFVLYHFYLIGKGNTTNERVRKNDEIDFYKKQVKVAQELQKRFTPDVKEMTWKGQKVTLKDLQQYQAICKKKKAIAQRVIDNKGFWGKLSDVFNL